MILDSSYSSLDEAVSGIEIPPEIYRTLALVDVQYWSFDDMIHQGQFVLHKDLAQEIKDIFDAILEYKFPIASVIPVAAFDWDDERSMEANNSSAFNYRHIVGTDILSNHSFGRAIDINPLQNPYYSRTGKVYPANATYEPAAAGTLDREGKVVTLFKQNGWIWYGEREEYTDYQHFQKLEP